MVRSQHAKGKKKGCICFKYNWIAVLKIARLLCVRAKSMGGKCDLQIPLLIISSCSFRSHDLWSRWREEKGVCIHFCTPGRECRVFLPVYERGWSCVLKHRSADGDWVWNSAKMPIWTGSILKQRETGWRVQPASRGAGEQRGSKKKRKKKEWENGRPAQESLFIAAWTLTAIYSTSHPCFQGMKKNTKERESKEGKKKTLLDCHPYKAPASYE